MIANLNARSPTITRSASYYPLVRKTTPTRKMCSSPVKTIACNYTWTIHNFSNQKKMLKSSLFSAGTDNEIETWRMHLYPNGDGDENKGYLSIFLCLEESNFPEVATSFEISIVDAAGMRTNTMNIRQKFKRDNDRWGSYGNKKYVSIAALTSMRKKLFPNDALTIYCEVNVFRESLNAARPSADVPDFNEATTCSLSDDFFLLFQNKKFSDVVFIVSEEKFYAHKVILAARCPAFSEMFDQEVDPRQLLSVNVCNMKKEVFAEILRYIYTGKAPNLSSLALDLLVEANNYKLPRLKSMCEQQISKNLTAENAAEILTLAEKYDANQLKAQTQDFIILHMEEVKNTEGFKVMARSHASLMIDVVSALAKKINSRFN